MDIHFICPHCPQSLVVDSAGSGEWINCPNCKSAIEIPSQTEPTFSKDSFSRKSFRSNSFVDFVIGNRLLKYLAVICAIVFTAYYFFPLIILAAALALYFIPSIVGRDKKNKEGIFILNFFLGWTGIGWVIALIWAVLKED